MSFLYMNNGKVLVTEEGKTLKSVKNLFKQHSKKFVEDGLRYIYFVYKPSGIYQHMLLKDRIKRTINEQYTNRKPEDFNDEALNAVIEDYNTLVVSTHTEKFYINIRKRMEELLDYLTNIKYTKKQKITNHKVEVEIEGERKEVYINTTIEIDNSKEALDAMKLVDPLLAQEEKWKKRMEKEKVTKSEDYKTLLERI